MRVRIAAVERRARGRLDRAVGHQIGAGIRALGVYRSTAMFTILVRSVTARMSITSSFASRRIARLRIPHDLVPTRQASVESVRSVIGG